MSKTKNNNIIMATTYQVTISLDDTTLKALKAGWQLQAFKGVKGSQTGRPVVWYSVDEFSNKVTLSWNEQYGAYVSNQKLINAVTVDISSQKDLDLGTKMVLDTDGSTSLTTIGAKTGSVVVQSQKDTEWICGMTQSVNGQEPTATCAFPLYGHTLDIMMPYESVVLLFASSQVDTGTVVEEALSSSVTITLSGGQPNINLIFDMNTGWNTSGNPYAKVNPNPIDLAAELIIPLP
jgi:hypothetical protein